MTDRRRYKQWSYALFYFIETNEVGVGKTTLVVDGYKNLSKGSYVKVHWPGDDTREYIARVLDLAGWFFLLESNLEALIARVKIHYPVSIVQRCASAEGALC